jgi:F-type H+-transporting ATPase subunit a
MRVKFVARACSPKIAGRDARATWRPIKMRNRCFLISILTLAYGVAFATSAMAAEAEAAVPLKPAPLVQIGKFAITNSMLLTWIVAAGIIVFAQVATRRIKPIPSGVQNFWEWLVEGLYNFLEGIIGRELVRKTFWFFATIFIFILFVNWFGLIPGVGTIGWGHYGPSGMFHVDRPLLRGGNADLNMTTAMAAIFFLLWLFWAIQAQGVGGFLKHLFAPKGETTGILKILMIVIFFMVGWLEVVSILFRPVSLSFRLFGNIYAGESTLETMSTMVPWLSWLLPIPFYFLEILVGIVQALVFTLLTAVFTLLIAQHGPGGEHAHT